MNIELMFPSKYVKAADLGDGPKQVTIDRVVPEDLMSVGGKKERKAVVYFRGQQKALVLGTKVNMRALVYLFGSSETDDWVGKRVVLHPTRDTFMGRLVDCIRVLDSPDAVNDMSEFVSDNPNYMRDLQDYLASR